MKNLKTIKIVLVTIASVIACEVGLVKLRNVVVNNMVTKYNKTSINRHNGGIEDIVFDTRSDAQEVLNQLDDLMTTYQLVSVADLYNLIGKTNSFTDNKYGWIDLKKAHVRRIRSGYSIDLPKTILLDKEVTDNESI